MNDGENTASAESDSATLTIDEILAMGDPFALFGEWHAQAGKSEPNDPDAMALATVDSDGMPDVRMVLLKGVDPAGFVFYTNLGSRKGEQLATVPKAALCFHWKSLRRQVRVRGAVEPVTAAEADAYFRTRARRSRIGAWASDQSRPLESRAVLERAVAQVETRFADGDIPRPPHWSGFRVRPQAIEFWCDGAFRLHNRVRFTPAAGGGWSGTALYP